MASYGYLIRSDAWESQHVIKIGITNNLKKRMAQIKTGSPSNLTLYHFFEFENRRDSRKWELKYHGIFRNKRTNGEWFILAEDDLLFIISETNRWIDGVRYEKKEEIKKEEYNKSLIKGEENKEVKQEEKKNDDGEGCLGCFIVLVMVGVVIYFASAYISRKNNKSEKSLWQNNELLKENKAKNKNDLEKGVLVNESLKKDNLKEIEKIRKMNEEFQRKQECEKIISRFEIIYYEFENFVFKVDIVLLKKNIKEMFEKVNENNVIYVRQKSILALVPTELNQKLFSSMKSLEEVNYRLFNQINESNVKIKEREECIELNSLKIDQARKRLQ